MTYVYDPEARAGYITVRPGNVTATRELGEGILIDVNEDGTAHGIELLDAWSEEFVKRWADALELLAASPKEKR